MQIKAIASMHTADAVYETPEHSGTGRLGKPGYRTEPVQARELAQSLSPRVLATGQ